MPMTRWFSRLLPIVLFVPLLCAQESQWRSVMQLRPGTKIHVIENSLRSSSGRFVSASESGITMTVDGKEVAVARDQIHRISLSGKNRKRNVLIGLAIGVGAGAGIGAATRQVVNDDKIIPLEAMVMGGLGAGIGAIAPASANVYKAEGPKRSTQNERAPSGAPAEASR